MTQLLVPASGAAGDGLLGKREAEVAHLVANSRAQIASWIASSGQ